MRKIRKNRRKSKAQMASTKGLIDWSAQAEQLRYETLLPKARHDPGKKPTIIIDGFNMAYRAYYAYSKLNGVEVIYGMPKLIETIIRQDRPEKLIVCWEGKRSPERLKLLPSYKSHRNKSREENPEAYKKFLKQVEVTKKLLYYLGIPQAWDENIEGDDMVYLCATEEAKLRRVKIISGDKDMLQLVNHDISVYNPHPKYPINRGTFGFSVQEPFVEIPQLVDYLCLVGDRSDDIPGIRGIGPKRACDFLRRWYSVKDYLKDEDATFTGMMDKDKVKKIYKRNRRLIDLKLFHKKYRPNDKVKYYRDKAFPRYREKKYLELCTKYKLKSFKFPNFINTFINL